MPKVVIACCTTSENVVAVIFYISISLTVAERFIKSMQKISKTEYKVKKGHCLEISQFQDAQLTLVSFLELKLTTCLVTGFFQLS